MVRLLLPAALALAACDPFGADGPTCQPVASHDVAEWNAWLAQPIKTCSLEAIFPSRAAQVTSTVSTGDPTGWDALALAEGADGNGVRSFASDGTRFAAFENYRTVDASVLRKQDLAHYDDCVDGPQVHFAARLSFENGTCLVSVQGVGDFQGPLAARVDVPLAWWPEVHPLPATDAPDAHPRALAAGFAYLDLPALPSPGSYLDADPYAELAGWLGATREQVAAHTDLTFAPGVQLLTVPGVESPPIVVGDDEPTILTAAEADALDARGGLFPAVWHYYSPGYGVSFPTDSMIEVTAGGMRYLGTQPRDTERAWAEGARCFADLVERARAAVVSTSPRFTPPFTEDTMEACAVLTSDLDFSLRSDERARAAAVGLYSDAAAASFGDRGPALDQPARYVLPHGIVQRAVADAMGAHLPVVEQHEPSVRLDHALASRAAIESTGVGSNFPLLAEPLIRAALRRAERSFELVALGQPALAPITAEDVWRVEADLPLEPSTEELEAAADRLAHE